ncbi:DUF885 domain-containing protein [Flectobacillus sp. BAB-3569]|uniref:DUF885 domain-containing protein n=1 Tax=Flectobacillus sp. BAB-3569 TaxID=1509483 RepID=UPI000BA3E1AF|nr:DUF885 domain-containing protein [Flectobacillus sp. BAB-3569]PAC27896.1 hypothetical protein BWI92_20905 [Flectobacillus sp. BAB-3569]
MKHFSKLTHLALVILLLTSCGLFESEDQKFEKVSSEFIENYLMGHPTVAVAQGYHQFDGKLPDFSKEGIDKEATHLNEFLAKFESLDTTKLSQNNLIDYYLLVSQVKNSLHKYNVLHIAERPLTYLGVIDLTPYVKRNYASIDQRAKAVIHFEKQLPNFLVTAKQNMTSINYKEEVELSIDAFRSTAEYVEKDIPKAFEKVYQKNLKDSLAYSTKIASRALRGFADYLQKHTLPRAHGKYAIGRRNYIKMLQYNELLDTNPEEILKIGLKKLKEEQREFAEAAKVIDSTKTPQEVFKMIQKEHPKADSLVSFTKNKCEEIRQFLIDHRIITIPSEVRAKVVKTPAFMVGATAAMDTPGPFEKAEASEAYYYVTPPSDKWTSAQKEEWLTLFNKYSTEVISIHEAYPGHYVQFLHLNASSVSRTRKLFGSYAFIEGWAHYTEQMMLEEGYGKSDDPKVIAKYKMAQLSESLLRLCRLVVSIKEHTAGWSVKEGTKFFMANCYYEEKPAYEEALRGTFDPGYLSYSLGKLQLLALKEDVKKRQGKYFSLRKFHDQATDNGMLPIQLLRKVMLH